MNIYVHVFDNPECRVDNNTTVILSIWTDRHGQSSQCLNSLPFCAHILDILHMEKTHFSNFRIIT